MQKNIEQHHISIFALDISNSNFTGIYSIWYDKRSINKVEIHASSLHQNYFIHVQKRVIHGRRKDIVDFRSSKVNHPNNSIQFVCMHVSHDDANLLYKQVYPKQELIIIRRYEMCHIYWHIQFVFLGMIISFSILKYFSFHHMSNVICCIVKFYLKLYKILYNLTHQILIVSS